MNINTPEHWDAAWAKHKDAYVANQARVSLAKHVLDMIPNGRVLDIGGGCGVLAPMIRDRVKVIDFSVYAVDYLHSLGIEAEVVDIRQYEEQSYGAFDVVVCMDFLEHIDEPQRAVKCAFNHANRAIFVTPNLCMPPSSSRDHVRMYGAESIKQELALWPNVRTTVLGNWLIAEAWK